eukprot:2819382-Rhodomonas_salina.1
MSLFSFLRCIGGVPPFGPDSRQALAHIPNTLKEALDVVRSLYEHHVSTDFSGVSSSDRRRVDMLLVGIYSSIASLCRSSPSNSMAECVEAGT